MCRYICAVRKIYCPLDNEIALRAVIFALCARYIVLSDNEIALRAVIFALRTSYIVLSDNDIAAKPQLRNIQIFFKRTKLP